MVRRLSLAALDITFLAAAFLFAGALSYIPVLAVAGSILRTLLRLPIDAAATVASFVQPGQAASIAGPLTVPAAPAEVPSASLLLVLPTPPSPADAHSTAWASPAAGIAVLVVASAAAVALSAIVIITLLRRLRRCVGDASVCLTIPKDRPAHREIHLVVNRATAAMVVASALATAIAEHASLLVAIGTAIGGAWALRPALSDTPHAFWNWADPTRPVCQLR